MRMRRNTNISIGFNNSVIRSFITLSRYHASVDIT
jgi:hypothetical protein